MKRLLLMVGLVFATPLAAQEDPLLAAAVQLATEGQGDSARGLVQQRLAEISPSDPLYPQALYAAGVVATDVNEALNYFRRVSIEYSRSSWADQALLRLAQLAFAAGDAQGALRSSQRILTDYPLSEVRAEANFWAGRANLELGNAEEGCRLLVEAEREANIVPETQDTTVTADVELAYRAAYHLQRCTSVFAGADSAAADTGQAAPGRPTGGPVVYSVQVAAVGTATAADQAMRSLHAAGYDPHVVRDTDGLFKVRVGRYAARQQAQQLAQDIRGKLGGSPFVVEER
jgi:tetratricopeptide (TPR) repeat protein